MTRILVLYPLDDIATSASAYVADRIANLLEEKGFEVFRFDLWKANRLLFTLQQLLKPADFIVYAGTVAPTAGWGHSLQAESSGPLQTYST